MSVAPRLLLAASLALAANLALAQAAPAPAAKPAASRPAPKANAAPPGKQVKLPTAADGDVTYSFDPVTNLPISAKDDRAEVVAVALSFYPKKPGEELRWSFYYALQFKDGAVPKFITVYAENKAPLKLEVGDRAPVLEGGVWSANSQPYAVDKKTFDSMIGKDPWILQRKFVIDYADGHQRTLHQLSIVTQTMRLQLLEKVTGQKLLAPAAK